MSNELSKLAIVVGWSLAIITFITGVIVGVLL